MPSASGWPAQESPGARSSAKATTSVSVVEQPVSVHDFHATILHQLGLDHKRLTYYFNGRNMRLTDVHGELIPQIAGNRSTTERTG